MSSATQESPIRVFLLIENRLLREALGRLCRKRPDLQVVGEIERCNLQQREFLESQCDVLTLDSFDATEVMAGIRAAFKGEAVCPPKLCSALFDWVASSPRPETMLSAPRPELTLRQRQLVALVAQGLANKEIAAHLNLSEFTVRNHIHRILKLVDAGTRREVVDIVHGRTPVPENIAN